MKTGKVNCLISCDGGTYVFENHSQINEKSIERLESEVVGVGIGSDETKLVFDCAACDVHAQNHDSRSSLQLVHLQRSRNTS